MAMDYSKLKGKIIEKFDSQGAFAEALGISENSLSSKLAGKRAFRQDEIFRTIKLLDADTSEIDSYFFTERV